MHYLLWILVSLTDLKPVYQSGKAHQYLQNHKYYHILQVALALSKASFLYRCKYRLTFSCLGYFRYWTK